MPLRRPRRIAFPNATPLHALALVTVLRQMGCEDEDVDIDLYVADHVWQSNERPLPFADQPR